MRKNLISEADLRKMIEDRLDDSRSKKNNNKSGYKNPVAEEVNKRWTDLSIARFLRIYRSENLLWDPTHKFYGDEERRIKAFGRIVKRLNLFGIGENDCIELVKSLRTFYGKEEEKKKEEKINGRESIAGGCGKKNGSPKIWYKMLEELIESVKMKIRKSADDAKIKLETDVYKKEARESCCEKLYPEDIWTPDNFRTEISDWFFPLFDKKEDDEEVECDCPELSEICFGETIRSVEKISTKSLSGCEIVPCFSLSNEGSSTSSSSKNIEDCCFEEVAKDSTASLPEKFSLSDSDRKLGDDETKNDAFCESESKKIEDRKSLSKCPLGNFINKNLYKDKKICDDKKQNSRFEKSNFIYCENFKRSNYDCRNNNDQVSIRGSTNSCDVSQSFNSELTSSLNSESKSLSSGKKVEEEEEEPIDRRLENQPDPTLCKKCAADRLRMFDPPKRRDDIASNKDRRIQYLDKYCRYKDWEAIYKIRTKYSNSNEGLEDIVRPSINDLTNFIQPLKDSEKVNKERGLSDMNYFHDRDNFLPKSEEGLIFTYPINSPYAREVGLIDDYKFEYGSKFKINQRRHYSYSENNDDQFFDYKSAQLTL